MHTARNAKSFMRGPLSKVKAENPVNSGVDAPVLIPGSAVPQNVDALNVTNIWFVPSSRLPAQQVLGHCILCRRLVEQSGHLLGMGQAVA